jgi:membrane-bound serine protease (ClpP class)
VVRKYVLYQVPGLLVALVAAAALVRFELVAPPVAVLLVAAWVAKDALLFPLVRAAYHDDARDGLARLVGETGVVVEALAPLGWVRIGGELWRAEAGTEVAAGERVTVTGFDGYLLAVRPLGAGDPSPS